MWQRRRRLQELEAEITQARAERAELRRRLDWFETIAAAAGAAVPGTEFPSIAVPRTTPAGTELPKSGQQDTRPLAPLPPNLLAAAHDLRGHDIPVRLEVAGAEVIAVVGGPGDPREWWKAIWQTAGPETAGPEEARL